MWWTIWSMSRDYSLFDCIQDPTDLRVIMNIHINRLRRYHPQQSFIEQSKKTCSFSCRKRDFLYEKNFSFLWEEFISSVRIFSSFYLLLFDSPYGGFIFISVVQFESLSRKIIVVLYRCWIPFFSLLMWWWVKSCSARFKKVRGWCYRAL